MVVDNHQVFMVVDNHQAQHQGTVAEDIGMLHGIDSSASNYFISPSLVQ